MNFNLSELKSAPPPIYGEKLKDFIITDELKELQKNLHIIKTRQKVRGGLIDGKKDKPDVIKLEQVGKYFTKVNLFP